MIDTTQVLQNTDLLALVGRDTILKRVASINGGEWAGPCPFCGGTDRFRVWPNADRPDWWCRGCGRWGDAISYTMQRDSLDFRTACERLGTIDTTSRPEPKKAVTSDQGPPSGVWQNRGREFVAYAQCRLWDRTGTKALAWLRARGLADDTLHHFNVGFNPTTLWDESQRWGLEGKRIWLPRGVVIPGQVNDALWYVKVRRPKGRPKYAQVRGSKSALFGADDLGNEGRLLLLAEGEFDAMLAKQEVGDLVDVAALCGAAKGITSRWLPYLLYPRLLVAYDGDEAGRKGAAKLATQSRRIVRIAIAGGGDLTDYYTLGGDLRGWLASEIEKHTPALTNAEVLAEIST